MAERQSMARRTQQLASVAAGREPADVVILGGTWVNVATGEILPGTDIAIRAGRIAACGPALSYTIGAGTQVIEAEGRYLVPGLLDGHMHVESTMLTVTQFARAVLPHGTTGAFVDPHEIANVFGLRGVRLMVDEAARLPMHLYVQMPSCVPAAPGLETNGASIGPAEVAEAMAWSGMIGLGEVMNFPGVIAGDPKMHEEMAVTRQFGKTVGGHYASADLGRPFSAYAVGGPSDDHEGTNEADAVLRARNGMYAMLRYGSAWHDVAAQVTAITERGLDPRRFLLVTDDRHAGTLMHDGHMDDVVRHAISQGLRPITAIQMATINTAEHFGVDADIGLIAPGRFADILLVENLAKLSIHSVICAGQIVAENGRLLADFPPFAYPDDVRHSVRLPKSLVATDFRIAAPANAEWVRAHVIGVIENQAPTRHLLVGVPVRDGEVQPDPDQDIARIAVIERHTGRGGMSVGLVQGLRLMGDCAIGSTVAHDSHNLLIVGTTPQHMAVAGNTLAAAGGGAIVVRNGEVQALLELPIAGLMSDRPVEEVAARVDRLRLAIRECGCPLNNAFMTISLLALVVIPELRISDLGLVDVVRFEKIALLAG